MEIEQTWRQWAHAFLFGDYRGAPVDYLMAIAIVFAMLAVVGVSIIRSAVPVIFEDVFSALLWILAFADYARVYIPS